MTDAPPTQPDLTDIIAHADDYDSLIAGLVARRHELGLPQRAVDDIAGIADGLCAKVECGSKSAGRISLTCLLGALGVRLLLVRTDPHPLARHLSPRKSASAILNEASRERAA